MLIILDKNIVMVLLFITLITMVGQKEKIREKCLHSQKRVEISFEGEKSELKDISTCYLCGLSNESLAEHLCQRGLNSKSLWLIFKEY